MYGRYVADVFYHPTINPSTLLRVDAERSRSIKKKEEVYEKGFFLNLELLVEGLADPMS
jgi:hypothetical protein